MYMMLDGVCGFYDVLLGGMVIAAIIVRGC